MDATVAIVSLMQRTTSFTKGGHIFIQPCSAPYNVLYPLETDPKMWHGCDDAYAYTWMSDFGNSIRALNMNDKVKLANSMGFCPHNRCQLTNLTSPSSDGLCPKNLCYTKLEKGGRSFGACCFTDGKFDDGDLIGYYDKTQNTPKPIYRRSRVVLGGLGGDDPASYSRFINANRIHPNIIATQCPLENTVLDVQRMLVEQNVSAWVQLAPYIAKGSSGPYPSHQCTMTPSSFVEISQMTNSSSNRVVRYESLANDNVGIRGGSFATSAMELEVVNEYGTADRQRVLNVWYKGWEDFMIPDKEDVLDLVALADYSAQIARAGGTVAVSCFSGRGRTGTFAALVLGRMQRVTTHSQLVDIIVGLREGRDGMLETPEQYRFVALALGLPDPAVCGAGCQVQRGLSESETVRIVVAVVVGALLVLVPVLIVLRNKSI